VSRHWERQAGQAWAAHLTNFERNVTIRGECDIRLIPIEEGPDADLYQLPTVKRGNLLDGPLPPHDAQARPFEPVEVRQPR